MSSRLQKRRSGGDARLRQYEQAYRTLCRRLAEPGFLIKGSVQRRWMNCGQSTCGCRKDPDSRHGPYYYWTSKVRGKTVAYLLSEEEGRVYIDWAGNRQQVEKTLQQLYRLSGQVARLKLGKTPPWIRR
jgi:hypothetical protein